MSACRSGCLSCRLPWSPDHPPAHDGGGNPLHGEKLSELRISFLCKQEGREGRKKGRKGGGEREREKEGEEEKKEKRRRKGGRGVSHSYFSAALTVSYEGGTEVNRNDTVTVYKALALCYFHEVCKTGWFLRAKEGLQPHFTDEETEALEGAANTHLPQLGHSGQERNL